MRPALATILALLLGLPCPSRAAEERPTGLNCSLPAPPIDSGEDFSHGATRRIYPRAKVIGTGYVGCQIVWAGAADGWSVVAVIAISNGEPTRIWSPDPTNPGRLACRYEHGRVVSGKAEGCPDPRFVIAKSLAPGCVAKRLEAVEERGFGAPAPQGCEYE